MQQLMMDLDFRIPKLDEGLKDLIKAEHRRAELRRLDTGWPGCGCADCQDFYKTIDLKKYGSRVKYMGEVILISEDKAKLAALMSDKWVGADQIYITHGQGYATAPDGKALFMGAESEIMQALSKRQVPGDAAPAQRAEYERIFELIKESEKSGESDRTIPGKRSYQSGARALRGKRGRLMLDSRRRPASARRATGTKRLSMRLS